MAQSGFLCELLFGERIQRNYLNEYYVALLWWNTFAEHENNKLQIDIYVWHCDALSEQRM